MFECAHIPRTTLRSDCPREIVFEARQCHCSVDCGTAGLKFEQMRTRIHKSRITSVDAVRLGESLQWTKAIYASDVVVVCCDSRAANRDRTAIVDEGTCGDDYVVQNLSACRLPLRQVVVSGQDQFIACAYVVERIVVEAHVRNADIGLLRDVDK